MKRDSLLASDFKPIHDKRIVKYNYSINRHWFSYSDRRECVVNLLEFYNFGTLAKTTCKSMLFTDRLKKWVMIGDSCIRHTMLSKLNLILYWKKRRNALCIKNFYNDRDYIMWTICKQLFTYIDKLL